MMRKTFCIVAFATGSALAMSPAAQEQLLAIRTLARQFAEQTHILIGGANMAAEREAILNGSAANLRVRLDAAIAAKNLLEQSPLRKWVQGATGCGLIDLRYLAVGHIPADATPLQQVDAHGHVLPRPAHAEQAFAVPMVDFTGWMVYERAPRNGLRGFEPHIQVLNAWIAQLQTLINLADARELETQREELAAHGAQA